MKYFKFTLSLLGLLFCLGTHAQSGEVYEDKVYDSLIKSVQIYIDGTPPIVPYIGLNSGFRSFTLRFDELAEEANSFYYKLIHCDRNWRASDLEEIEYLDGFNGEEIQSYEYSTNTYVDYVHYSLTLPNEDTRFKISGNYILIIYDDEDLTNPVLSRRFMINESTAEVYTNFRQVNDVEKSFTHHQFDVEANLRNLKVGDRMNEISIDILQNNRWDNRISNEYPKFIVKDRIKFDNTGKLTIPAGKEFRWFDIRTLQSTSRFVKEIDLHNDGTDVILRPRRKGVTRNELDFDGRYIIYSYDFRQQIINDADSLFKTDYENVFLDENLQESMYRADYANVIFGLESSQMLEEIYVLGAFNDWTIHEDYKMKYSEGNGYVVNTLLKQGVYNYLFASKDLDGKPNYEFLEGNDRRTVNYYTTILYYSDFTDQYDRIIAIDQNSTQDEYFDLR